MCAMGLSYKSYLTASKSMVLLDKYKEEARKIAPALTDEEIVALYDAQYALAEMIFEAWKREKTVGKDIDLSNEI